MPNASIKNMQRSFEELKKNVCEQNKRLPKSGLVILSEGNVSQITEDRRYFAIKPSGVEYDDLTPEKMVIVDREGNTVESDLRPSTDTPTHLEIYRRFPEIGGITHTHSPFATMYAQMKKPIPCYGTTHADAFCGDIPVTRELTREEIFTHYELHTGKAIAEILDPLKNRCVLVASHGPFAFGKDAKEAVHHACILEKVAMMAILATPESPISDALIQKHHERKWGQNKYYGQGEV